MNFIKIDVTDMKFLDKDRLIRYLDGAGIEFTKGHLEDEIDGITFYALEHLIILSVGDKIVKRYHAELQDGLLTDPMHWKVIKETEKNGA